MVTERVLSPDLVDASRGLSIHRIFWREHIPTTSLDCSRACRFISGGDAPYTSYGGGWVLSVLPCQILAYRSCATQASCWIGIRETNVQIDSERQLPHSITSDIMPRDYYYSWFIQVSGF